ncbi:MAG: hypothetical protein R2745_20680 [Vicinamibacterales bacterium]
MHPHDRARRRSGLAALFRGTGALLLWMGLGSLGAAALPARADAQQVVDLASDTTWNVSNSSHAPIGQAVYVCPNATFPQQCPAGATLWDWPDPGFYPTYAEIPGANSIWAPGETSTTSSSHKRFIFRKSVVLVGTPVSGTFYMTADDYVELRVNGSLVGAVGSTVTPAIWPLEAFDVLPFLTSGTNTFEITAENGPTSFGLGLDTYSNNPANTIFGGRLTATGNAGPPGAPAIVQAEVSGQDVRLRWSAPTTGGAATAYTLLARLAPGAPPVASVPLGAAMSLNVTAPPGLFILTVQASNTAGTGPESAQAQVLVPQPAVPPGPATLTASVTGTTVNLTWTAPTTGGFPTGYQLLAGATPGFTQPIASVPLPATATTLSIPGVPFGTYYLRLVATGAAGAGPASNEVTVVVTPPVLPGAPSLSAQVSGHTVTLSWTPGTGGAPDRYQLLVGGLLVDAGASTSISAPNVPSGAYVVNIRGLNAAGAGPFSVPVTFLVP